MANHEGQLIDRQKLPFAIDRTRINHVVSGAAVDSIRSNRPNDGGATFIGYIGHRDLDSLFHSPGSARRTHDDVIDIVRACILGRFKIRRGLEGHGAGCGINDEQGHVGAARDGIGERRSRVRIRGRDRVDHRRGRNVLWRGGKGIRLD